MPEANTQLSPVTDERSAAAHIEGLLDLSGNVDVRTSQGLVGDSEVTDDVESPEDNSSVDAAPEETPASEQPEDDEIEPSGAIDPPSSWNSDEKSKFAQLPPDLQKTIARRESERDTAISRKMNEIAETRKAVEAQSAQATQVQTQYANTVNQLLSLTIPELQQIEQTDWQKLATDDPAEYVRMSAVRDGLRQRVGFMAQQVQQAQAQQQQQLLAQHHGYLAHQYESLVEQVPEFRDPSKAKALVDDIGETMSAYGFTPPEIGSVSDARIVRVMARLAQLEKLDQARKSALGKKSGAPAPRFITPNAAPVREDNRNRKIADQYDRLKRSGSARDAGRLIENIL